MASNKDRQRKLARERHERRLTREAQRRARSRQLTKWSSVGLVVAALIAVVTLTALHLSSTSAATPVASPSTSAPPASASPSPSVSPASSPTPNAQGLVQCAYVAKPPASRNVGLPPHTASVKGSYQATITTNRGSIVINLLNSKAPCTVNSFDFLAVKKFFDNTPCHRLTTSGIYVLQCGDPSGTGTGGPGYEFPDENLTGATYPPATVAMANSGANTNGSQFFLVYQNSPLPPSYTPFGTIVSGLNVLQAIAKVGSDNSNNTGDGHPKEKVTIETVTIKKT